MTASVAAKGGQIWPRRWPSWPRRWLSWPRRWPSWPRRKWSTARLASRRRRRFLDANASKLELPRLRLQPDALAGLRRDWHILQEFAVAVTLGDGAARDFDLADVDRLA